MIHKIDFHAKKLASNTGLFLLLENARSNWFFNLLKMTMPLIKPQQI